MTGRRRTTRVVTGALALLVTTLLMWASAPSAQAHTELEQARPAQGEKVDRLPAQAALRFNEDVAVSDLIVRVAGKVLTAVPAPGHPGAFTVDLRSIKPAKTVVLTWQIIDSHDGHVSEGNVTFHVRGKASSEAAAAPAQTSTPSEPKLLGPAEVTARIVGYLAMAVLIGGLLFVSLLWPAGAEERRTRIVLLGAVVAGASAAAAEVAITLWRADGSLTLTTALTEDFGRTYAAKALLWLLAAVIVVGAVQGGGAGVRRLPWRVGALVVAVGLIRLTGMNAHASQGPDAAWGEIADFLHLAGVSAWIGGLVVLTVGVLPRRRLDELEEVVPRFSKVAQISVLMIIASGLLLVWQLIWPLDWGTHYSRVLVVKLALFVLVLLAAMASKRWVDGTLTGTAATRRPNAVQSIATSVAAETVLVVAVLGAASVLATSSPGV